MSFRIGQPYGCDEARSAYNPLMPHVLLATLVVLHLSSAIMAQERGNSAPVRVQMSYFAKPGKEDEVLQLRIKAAEILERAGVGRGRVWRLIESPRATKGESPTVMWEGEFASEAALKAYEEVADKNPDFLAARRQMTDLTVKFERRYFREGR